MNSLVADLERGYEDQLVMGHDVSLKASLRRFGGLGYDHILRRMIPTLRSLVTVDGNLWTSSSSHNPRRLLARPAGAALPTPKPSQV